MPLAGIDLQTSPYTITDIYSFISHADRVFKADTKYPILISDKGYIMDGWHRVCKAIINGDTHIKAIRFDSMPKPSGNGETK
jgi:hypothetical protein